MSKYLFLYNLRSNRVLIIAFTLILAMYSSIATGMYDPESLDSMNSMLELIPEGMAKALNFQDFGTELTSYITKYLYGFIFFMFPIIFIILVGNKILAKHVDSGSMAYLLTTPHSRIKIATTQAVFLASATAFVVLFNTLLIIVMSIVMFPGELKIINFIMVNITTLSVLLLISSITFLFSVIFNESSYALGFSSGVAAFFFITNAVRNISEEISFLKFFTPLSLVNINRILEGGAYSFIVSSIVIVFSFVIYLISIYIFNKRSLSI